MRSPREILFRLKQEAGNVWLLAAQPARSDDVKPPLRGLPDPEAVASALRGSPFAREALRIADDVLAHRFPILGFTLETGPEIAWRRDSSSGIETGLGYFRRIPYLDPRRAGDHKVIWELNRHQHWVLLAQAWLLSGRRDYLDEIRREFESWSHQNPFQRGVNWTSALEVAFRAISWLWVLHLAGGAMPPEFRRELLSGLYRQGLHLERNLSIYFSPNTHLLGEAVALHALGSLFTQFPRRWEDTGGRIVREQLARQVQDDGSHFEQSSYYHVYALDMFLFHAAVARGAGRPVEAGYIEKLGAMAEYLAALMGPQRTLPFLGDDDGGRFFHPYGERDRFGRATLATCAAFLGRPDLLGDAADLCEQTAWWLGPFALDAQAAVFNRQSRFFADAGVAAMTRGDVHILVDAGPFGAGSAGHSHSDTLSVVVRKGGREILVDPGTYTYVGDPDARERFRGSASHNTIRIDGMNQAVPAGPFRWSGRPCVRLNQWTTSADKDEIEAECSYARFTHRRRVTFTKPDVIDIVDTVNGPPGEHTIEQFWHLGPDAGDAVHVEGAETIRGWRSRALGQKEPIEVLRVVRKSQLPVRLSAVIQLR